MMSWHCVLFSQAESPILINHLFNTEFIMTIFTLRRANVVIRCVNLRRKKRAFVITSRTGERCITFSSTILRTPMNGKCLMRHDTHRRDKRHHVYRDAVHLLSSFWITGLLGSAVRSWSSEQSS